MTSDSRAPPCMECGSAVDVEAVVTAESQGLLGWMCVRCEVVMSENGRPVWEYSPA